MMKCWKMNLRPGQNSWWGPTAWRLGALGLWMAKLRKLNGPNFTAPLLMFASAAPEALLDKMGKIYVGRPITIKTRRELLATVRPSQWRYLRQDTGDVPEIPPELAADALAATAVGSKSFLPLTAVHDKRV